MFALCSLWLWRLSHGLCECTHTYRGVEIYCLQTAKVENMFVPACVNHNCRSNLHRRDVVFSCFQNWCIIQNDYLESGHCSSLLGMHNWSYICLKNNLPNTPTQVSKINVIMPEQLHHRQRLRPCFHFLMYTYPPHPWSCSINTLRKVRPSKCPRLMGAEKVAMPRDQVDGGVPFQESICMILLMEKILHYDN